MANNQNMSTDVTDLGHNKQPGKKLSRYDFPEDFLFGAASSAYQEDVALMKKLGLDTYRFSISWSRILPCGRLGGGINREGVKFYNDLIDLLLAAGMILLSMQMYASFEFGDRVKHWITINESWTYAHNGYATELFRQTWFTFKQPIGNGVANGVARYRSAPVVDNTHIGGNSRD
ncbi:hypothetical protein DH2020_026526 [Rehmannia glutinosa]|uniref:Uncharacterized protein n=1 Tax=Rehmannia glutinosa TaxID=99300 RepID=A0ABR0VWP1_REHGL